MIVIRAIQFWTVLFIWQKRAGGGVFRPSDKPGRVLLVLKPIKSPSCCRLQKISKFAKKGVDNMAEIREPPKTLREFENLTWSQKRQLKESSPDVYWFFIEQVQELECKEKEN